ncbi:hypothetical protein LINGRAHAP2_LOCUS27521 [Linum grandiflorum]
MVARWSPEFDETALIRKVLTWVRLPKHPIQYFNDVAVSSIGNYIGRTVRLDLATAEGARGRFARLCVEVDLSKPLLGKYRIADRLFYIEYESLDNLCTLCGMYGHKRENCPTLMPEPTITPPVVAEKEVEKPEEGDAGAWMTVTRRNHRRRGKDITQHPVAVDGSRFRLLRRCEEEGRLDIPPSPPSSQTPMRSMVDPKPTRPQTVHAELLVGIQRNATPEMTMQLLADSPTHGSNVPSHPTYIHTSSENTSNDLDLVDHIQADSFSAPNMIANHMAQTDPGSIVTPELARKKFLPIKKGRNQIGKTFNPNRSTSNKRGGRGSHLDHPNRLNGSQVATPSSKSKSMDAGPTKGRPPDV